MDEKKPYCILGMIEGGQPDIIGRGTGTLAEGNEHLKRMIADDEEHVLEQIDDGAENPKRAQIKLVFFSNEFVGLDSGGETRQITCN